MGTAEINQRIERKHQSCIIASEIISLEQKRDIP